MLYGGPLYEQTRVYVLIFLLIYRIFPIYAITNSDVMKSLNMAPCTDQESLSATVVCFVFLTMLVGGKDLL